MKKIRDRRNEGVPRECVFKKAYAKISINQQFPIFANDPLKNQLNHTARTNTLDPLPPLLYLRPSSYI